MYRPLEVAIVADEVLPGGLGLAVSALHGVGEFLQQRRDGRKQRLVELFLVCGSAVASDHTLHRAESQPVGYPSRRGPD